MAWRQNLSHGFRAGSLAGSTAYTNRIKSQVNTKVNCLEERYSGNGADSADTANNNTGLAACISAA